MDENYETESDEPEERFEIEVVDDTPEADRGKEYRSKGDVDASDDEISQYSDNVKRRIKELSRAYHDERREKERLGRENNEAVNLTQKLAVHNKQLQDRLSAGERELVETSRQRTAAQMAHAEREYKDAFEAGDTDRIIAAQKLLSENVVYKRELDNYQPQYQAPLHHDQKVVERQPEIVPDERTQQWVEENDWFDKDSVMRGAAFGIHDDLVKTGYVAGSDIYFERLNARIREEFPQKFGSKRPAANVVASASRGTAGTKKISLTKSQVALAKRLNLPLETYAAYAAKELNNVR